MGASLPSNEKGSVVDLNIVPFVDLMSCLTAFLLVTAVWVGHSALQNEPVGTGRSGEHPVDQEPQKVAVLIEYDQISITHSPSGEARLVQGHDWARVESALREFRTPHDEPTLEVAGASSNEHPIRYQDLMTAMDTAQKAGYPRVGVTEPRSLAMR